MSTRDYYIQRIGQNLAPPRLTLGEVAAQIEAAYRTADDSGYLQRSFGYYCVDEGTHAGLHGTDFRLELYLRTRIRIEGVIPDAIARANEAELFTLIEFIHDHVAKPRPGSGRFHDWSNCGLHLDAQRDKFDEATARKEWRDKVNAVLKFYGDGYELSTEGEIVHLAPHGMERLVATAPAPTAEATNAAKLANAVHTFQLGRSTREQRKQAVRDLVDILEFHRPAVKQHLLSKDEDDLFNIANNFALRHHNQRQKDDYDDAWLTWLFYVYLATAHLMLGRVGGVDGFAATTAPAPEAPQPPDDDIPF